MTASSAASPTAVAVLPFALPLLLQSFHASRFAAYSSLGLRVTVSVTTSASALKRFTAIFSLPAPP